MDNDTFVTINIGGRRFTTSWNTLKNVPDTKLANLTDTDPAYVRSRDEFFFDRNPDFFGPILDFYRHGELHFSHCFCGKSIQKELTFWGIDEHCIASCCWQAYKQHANEKKTIDKLERTLYNPGHQGIDDDNKKEQGQQARGDCCSTKQRGRWRELFWRFLEYPQSSKGAQAWAIVVYAMILMSIAVVVMESHPDFRIPRHNEDILALAQNITNPKERMYYETELHPSLDYIDGACLAVFTLELISRFLVCPSKLSFFKSGYNIVDIFSVLPLVAYFLITHADRTIVLRGGGGRFLATVIYLSLSNVLRVFRLFKVAKHYRALKILQLAVRSSLKELSLLLLLITTGTLFFSTLIYFAEFQIENSDFMHIPIGFWWSTITMTTVGYGDKVPQGAWGYLVGGICAIAGMLITGLPIPIIASNFNHYYTYARLTTAMVEKRKCEKQIWKGNSSHTSNFLTSGCPSMSGSRQTLEGSMGTPPTSMRSSANPTRSTAIIMRSTANTTRSTANLTRSTANSTRSTANPTRSTANLKQATAHSIAWSTANSTLSPDTSSTRSPALRSRSPSNYTRPSSSRARLSLADNSFLIYNTAPISRSNGAIRQDSSVKLEEL